MNIPKLFLRIADDKRKEKQWSAWHPGSRLDQKKVGENNGQLRFRPPPWVAHASRLDQKSKRIQHLDQQFIFDLNFHGVLSNYALSVLKM